MSEQNEGPSNGGNKVRFRTITLHRTRSDKDRIIEENLKNLEFRTKKKRIAQAHYYDGGVAGQSPLTRANSVIVQNKQPVHARLGNGRIRLRKPYNFNDQGIFVKNRRILHINRNGGNMKLLGQGRRTIFKKQSAQIRLQRIRQQQLPENIHNGAQNIKLRRSRPNLMQPMNYTVEVNNRLTYGNQHISYPRHSIAAQLNKQLQADIKMIQAQNPPVPQLIPPLPIPAITFGVTTITIDHRFSKQDMEHV